MKNNWIKKIIFSIVILFKFCFSGVDTTICILIPEKDTVHVCAKIQGNSKSERLSVCFFVKEFGENKIIYKTIIPDCCKGKSSFWDSLTLQIKCYNQEECRWSFIQTQMIGYGLISEEPDKIQSDLKKQLIEYLILNAKLSKQEALNKMNNILNNGKSPVIHINIDPVRPTLGPFLWVEETKSFFKYQQKD